MSGAGRRPRRSGRAAAATRGPVTLALALFALALVDLLLVRQGWTDAPDRAGMAALRSGAAAWRWLTLLGNGELRAGIAIGAVLVMLAGRAPRAAAVTVLAAGGGAILYRTLKAAVLRPRPDLLPHLVPVEGWSWPSGHAAGSAALYLALALLAPARWRGPALAGAAALVLLIGLSRVALGVHWPSDVVAGWCVGGGWALLCAGLLGGRARSR